MSKIVKILVLLAVMQSAATASDLFEPTASVDDVEKEKHHKSAIKKLHCSRIRCPDTNCPAEEISSNSLHESSEISLTNENFTVTCRCPLTCSRDCHLTTPNLTLRHLEEVTNPLDPCESFFCINGNISTHIASCRSINCPAEHRILPSGSCCEICDSKFSTFCDDDDNRECDIACRLGYVKDVSRKCDLCKCLRPVTSTSTEKAQLDIKILEDERNLQLLVICVLIFVTIFTFGCLCGLLMWLVRWRMYKRIPLVRQRDGSHSVSTNSTTSGCEGV